MEAEILEGCDVCGENHDTEKCPELGFDEFEKNQLSRARLTVPHFLYCREDENGTAGIWTKQDIPARQRFGPFESKKTTQDMQVEDGFVLKILLKDGSSICLDTSEESSCNWMCLVQTAQNQSQQNLMALPIGVDIYFTSTKVIPKGTQLRVWYAPHYARKLGKPPTPDGKTKALLGQNLESGASEMIILTQSPSMVTASPTKLFNSLSDATLEPPTSPRPSTPSLTIIEDGGSSGVSDNDSNLDGNDMPAEHRCDICKLSFFSEHLLNTHQLSHKALSRTETSTEWQAAMDSLEHYSTILLSTMAAASPRLPHIVQTDSRQHTCRHCGEEFDAIKELAQHTKVHLMQQCAFANVKVKCEPSVGDVDTSSGMSTSKHVVSITTGAAKRQRGRPKKLSNEHKYPRKLANKDHVRKTASSKSVSLDRCPVEDGGDRRSLRESQQDEEDVLLDNDSSGKKTKTENNSVEKSALPDKGNPLSQQKTGLQKNLDTETQRSTLGGNTKEDRNKTSPQKGGGALAENLAKTISDSMGPIFEETTDMTDEVERTMKEIETKVHKELAEDNKNKVEVIAGSSSAVVEGEIRRSRRTVKPTFKIVEITNSKSRKSVETMGHLAKKDIISFATIPAASSVEVSSILSDVNKLIDNEQRPPSVEGEMEHIKCEGSESKEDDIVDQDKETENADDILDISNTGCPSPEHGEKDDIEEIESTDMHSLLNSAPSTPGEGEVQESTPIVPITSVPGGETNIEFESSHSIETRTVELNGNQALTGDNNGNLRRSKRPRSSKYGDNSDFITSPPRKQIKKKKVPTATLR